MTTYAIGIDLGTTNSVMARMNRNLSRVIDNADNDPLTPSVVHITEDGEHVVGKMAKAYGGKDPDNTVFSIKRFMGRDFNDPVIQDDIRKSSYRVLKADNGEVEVELRGRRYSPPEISSFILAAMKSDAEAALGGEVTHAVITVPAYFGNRHKHATYKAGKLAGLEVMRIIPEPTAAALAFGVDQASNEPKTVLVYDLGGGTFDVTVMYIAAGVFQDMGKNGDMHLGGDDFDQKIMDWMIEQVRIQHRVEIATLPNAREVLFRLKQEAETAKIRLSRQMRANILIPGLVRSAGRIVDVECELTRDEFNRMIRSKVEHSIDLVHQAMKDANTLPNEIDAILLVGGSTRVPMVEESLRKVFGEKVVRSEVNPMHCVAQGAAIQTNLPMEEIIFGADVEDEGTVAEPRKVEPKDREKPVTPMAECMHCGHLNPVGTAECGNCHQHPLGENAPQILIELLPHPIGIELDEGGMAVILDERTPFPTREPGRKMLYTAYAGQERVRLPVYEGRNDEAKKNDFLGEAIGSLPKGLPAHTPVEVELSIDGNGILYVRASLPDRPEVTIEAHMAWGDRGTTPTPPPDPDGPSWKGEAQYMIMQAQMVNAEAEGVLTPVQLAPMNQLSSQLALAIETGDETNARAIMKQLEAAVNNLGVFFILGLARIFSMNPQIASQVGLTKADELSRLVKKADQNKVLRNVPGLVSTVNDEITPLVEEIIKSLGQAGLSDLLSGSSGQPAGAGR